MSASAETRRRVALAAILVLAFALRAVNLDQQGWGADYYSAAVLGMSRSLHNFFFVAFDPAGFISVDKPPLALWLQALVVKLFGLSPLALLLPQALIGTACVWLVHRLARHGFGEPAALLAAAFMAVTPVLVAVNRTNNMDTTLLLCLLASAAALLRATERGSRGALCAAMAGLGLAFNIKMLAGVLLTPVFGVVYLLMAPVAVRRRIVDLSLSALVLLAVSLPWVVAVQLTPSEARPHVGSSPSNSMLELVFGHNARNRLYSPRVERQAAQSRAGESEGPAFETTSRSPAVAEPGLDTRATVRELAARLFVRNPTGPLRLLSGQVAAQIGWFAPLVAVAVLVFPLARSASAEPADTQARRRRRISVAFWSGWLLCYWGVYSFLGGIIHFYYLSTLAPALAVLAAASIVALRRAQQRRAALAWLLVPLPLLLVLLQAMLEASAMGWTSAPAFWSQREEWLNAAHAIAGSLAVLAAVAFVLAALKRSPPDGAAPAGTPPTGAVTSGAVTASAGATGVIARAGWAATLSAMAVLPLVWSASSVAVAGPGIVPSADLYRWQAALRDPTAYAFMRYGRAPDTTRLVEFLLRERRGERFLLATSTTQWAAPIIIATGEPVMARGGYHGLDRAVTPERLGTLVRNGELRFALIDDVASVSRRLGADLAGREVSDWIRANGRPIDPSQWRAASIRGNMALYDLRPRSPGERTP